MIDLYETIVQWRRSGRRGALATIVSAHGSIPARRAAKMLVGEDGALVGTIGGGCVEADVFQAAREVIESGVPRTLSFNLNKDPKYDAGLVCGGTLEVFVEPVLPDPVLYLFGAGHVGLNVYKVATLAGFEVVVIDDRDAFASRERFPEAREVVVGEVEAVCARLVIPESAYVVIATRGHRDDLKVLRWAVGTQAGYVGMLGSRRKVIAISRTLEQEGVPAERLDRVHSPVGLEIGAATPEEIAVSVVAELIALRRRCAAAVPHMRLLRQQALRVAAAAPAAASAGAAAPCGAAEPCGAGEACPAAAPATVKGAA